MFKWAGKDVLNGIIDEAKKKIGGIDIQALINKTPFLRVVPYIYGYWDTLSEEEKKKYAAIIFKAAMKAAETYGNS